MVAECRPAGQIRGFSHHRERRPADGVPDAGLEQSSAALQQGFRQQEREENPGSSRVPVSHSNGVAAVVAGQTMERLRRPRSRDVGRIVEEEERRTCRDRKACPGGEAFSLREPQHRRVRPAGRPARTLRRSRPVAAGARGRGSRRRGRGCHRGTGFPPRRDLPTGTGSPRVSAPAERRRPSHCAVGRAGRDGEPLPAAETRGNPRPGRCRRLVSGSTPARRDPAHGRVSHPGPALSLRDRAWRRPGLAGSRVSSQCHDVRQGSAAERIGFERERVSQALQSVGERTAISSSPWS